MSFLAVLKRFAPFVLTLALGLFIASFFVSLAAPNFQRFERGKGWKYRQIKKDNESLRREMWRLKKENRELRQNAENWDAKKLKYVVPPVELDETEPAPRHRNHRHEIR